MRYSPIAVALSLCFALTASVGHAEERPPHPRAAELIAEGKAALATGSAADAVAAFEAALVVDPAHNPTLILLAEAARRDGMQGKAITYYRAALAREPKNLAAISGEGAALVEKGAVEKARANLAKLKRMCGDKCREAKELAAVIDRGPKKQVVRAENIMPDVKVIQN